MKIFQLIFLFSLAYMPLSIGQDYQLTADSAVSVTVTGTSTLHGWTVTAGQVEEVPKQLSITEGDNRTIVDFGFKVRVNSMDGGRGASMNTKIKNELKEEQHPTIVYRQTEPATVTHSDTEGLLNITSVGVLNIAGIERNITVNLEGQKIDNQLIIRGSEALKFSELDIEPPSAMFGQIVCGDDIAVNFEFRYTTR